MGPWVTYAPRVHNTSQFILLKQNGPAYFLPWSNHGFALEILPGKSAVPWEAPPPRWETPRLALAGRLKQPLFIGFTVATPGPLTIVISTEV